MLLFPRPDTEDGFVHPWRIILRVIISNTIEVVCYAQSFLPGKLFIIPCLVGGFFSCLGFKSSPV